MAARRMVVVGGDAAGMSAASQARRLLGPDELEIVAFERGTYTSYSACGIPYWVAGLVDGPDGLVARTPEEHRSRGIDVRTRTEVTALDLAGRRVAFREAGTDSSEQWIPYDDLVVATGARPLRPKLPGIDAPGVHGVQSLEDGRAVFEELAGREGSETRAVVIGGGYIGVEMAEALLERGCRVTVLERNAEPLPTLDPDMGALVHEAMSGMGVETVTDAEVTEICTGPDGRVASVATADARYPADVVVLGLGVRPETSLAQDAGLPLGESGGLLTDPTMRVRGHEHVWAAGDCTEVLNLVSGRTAHIPLGTHANKQGVTAGVNIGGGRATFPGVVGTAVSKVCDLEIARTGLLEAEAEEAGFGVVSVTAEATSRAGYFPGSEAMTVKMLAERGTGRLLGAQIVGREGAGKRVDIAAVALTAGMTVRQLTVLDLGYAPPFSPVWDPVQVAARKAVLAVESRG